MTRDDLIDKLITGFILGSMTMFTGISMGTIVWAALQVMSWQLFGVLVGLWIAISLGISLFAEVPKRREPDTTPENWDN